MKRFLFLLLFIMPLRIEADLTKDINCLAHNIYFESRNQSASAQFAVGFVTMNRVKSPQFPNNICDVVKQRHQFSWYWDGLSDKPKNKKAYALAEKIASMILSGRFVDNTGGALFYHSYKVKPKWAKHMEFIAQYEDHLFYRPKK